MLREPAPALKHRALLAVAALAPWSWFALRNTSPFLEVVAVLLPVLAGLAVAGATAVALATRRRRWLVVPAVWATFGVVAVLGPWLPHGLGTPRQPVTVLVANTLNGNPTPDAAVGDIERAQPDIVVVPEIDREIAARLTAKYPNRVRVGGIAVFSRLPMSEPTTGPQPPDPSRQIRVEVDGPAGRFVLWALHLPRPWFVAAGNYQERPRAQAATLDEALRRIDAETLPVVVAGDLNLTDRGRGYHRAAAGRRDAMQAAWGGPTEIRRLFRPLFLTIDHVLVPRNWCADRAHRVHLAGSDHRGITVRVGPCTG